MRGILSWSGIALLLLGAVTLLTPTLVAAQPQFQTPLPSTSPTLFTTDTPGQTVGPHFFFGETVTLTENLTGDVYVFARNVSVENAINGDLLVAAGQVTIPGTVTQDVRAAAGNVDVRGMIGGNLTAAGATINLDRQSRIGESLVAAAGNIDINGIVNGASWLSSSVLTISGQLMSDVNVHTEKISLLDGAVITGNLQGQYQEPPMIAEGVQITGQQDLQPRPVRAEHRPSLARTAQIAFVSLLFILIMSIVAGGVLLALFPAVAEASSSVVMTRPLASLGWGISHLILTPVAAIMLMATVIGLPLGGVVLLLYGLSLVLGIWVVALGVGRKLWSPARTTFSVRFLQFGLGILILGILSVIPILGWVVKIIALMLGMGALVITVRQALAGRLAVAPTVLAANSPTTPPEIEVLPAVMPVKTITKPTTKSATSKVTKVTKVKVAKRKTLAKNVTKIKKRNSKS